MVRYTEYKLKSKTEEKESFVEKLQKLFKAGKKYIELSAKELKNVGWNEYNRKINKGHLSKIKKDIINSLSNFPPIVINVITGDLIDGQHRLKAFLECVRLGLIPEDSKLGVILVEIEEDNEFKTIVDINTNSKNWVIDDYVMTYVKQGIESYVLLDDFCREGNPLLYNAKTEKLNYINALCIIGGYRGENELKHGEANITPEHIDFGRKKLTQISKIIKDLGLKTSGAYARGILQAWVISSEKYNHTMTEWVTELKKNRYWKDRPHTKSEFLDIFCLAHSAIEDKKLSKVA